MEAYDFALSINKDNPFASLCKTTALIKSGNIEKAMECILDVLNTSPGDADFLCSLGECYESEYNLEEDEDCYIQAIENGTTIGNPYWKLAKIRYAENDFEGAVRTIDKALEFEPDDEKYTLFRGKCLIRLILNHAFLNDSLEHLNIEMNYQSDKSDDSEFMNNYRKAVFFYNMREMEQCCKYLLESIRIDSNGLDMFFELIPDAKEDAFIINYMGKYFK
jgi:tetratricopeptide (TPR) repeat protein